LSSNTNRNNALCPSACDISLTEKELSRLPIPTLVIAGGRDLFAPPEHSQLMLRLLPNAMGISMGVASHMGLAGHASIVLSLIRNFLRHSCA
jgi:pimeloyl-ACP methyl ester carboxylesterase